MRFKNDTLTVCKPITDSKLNNALVLVHTSSISDYQKIIARLNNKKGIMVGVASDLPQVDQFLKLSEWNISCYFNSFMAEVHYHQMLEMVKLGQKWIVPQILEEALELAKKSTAINKKQNSADIYSHLTKKEQQVAYWASQCLSNKEIARQQKVTERTIKAHLTRIYHKLGIRDRTALVALLNQNS